MLPSSKLVALIPFLLTSGTTDVGDAGLSRNQLALLDTSVLSQDIKCRGWAQTSQPSVAGA